MPCGGAGLPRAGGQGGCRSEGAGGTEAGLGMEAGVLGGDANSVGWGLEMPGEWCVPSLGHSGAAQGVACQEAEVP